MCSVVCRMKTYVISHDVIDPATNSINIMIYRFTVDPPILYQYAIGSYPHKILLNCMENMVSIIEDYIDGCKNGPYMHIDYPISSF